MASWPFSFRWSPNSPHQILRLPRNQRPGRNRRSRSRLRRQRLHRRLHLRSRRHLSNSQRLPNHLRRDPFDAFLIKIRPSGTGASDLAYGTFLGGAGLDQALAISVDAAMPATAYVTGTTQSTIPHEWNKCRRAIHPEGNCEGKCERFCLRHRPRCHHRDDVASLLHLSRRHTIRLWPECRRPCPQRALHLRQNHLMGSPWFNNLQPFTGNEDAFVAKFDPTAADPASLIYATPLAGTATPGGTAVTDGNAIAADELGDVFVAGRSTSSDFQAA